MSWAGVPTPWGEFYAGTDGASLVALRFPGPRPGEAGPRTPIHDRLAAELGEYLTGRRREFRVPFLARGTPFQEEVWEELARIPYGTTIAYGELASRLAHPRAARAVGQALAANPLPILIPCHRVVPAGGGIGGFGPGPAWKKRLLALEGTSD